MKKVITFSLASLAILAPKIVLSQTNSAYTMPDASFRQFVCSYLEGESNRRTAVSKIKSQIASIMSEEQEEILGDIKRSNKEAIKFCPGLEK
ncbi:MAG: hypothetical protein QNJ55_19220 [Xenococcus sp. MO_188.B8]|nr:hypothetical protein [Xenococcus sp. MO_188.B8]